MNKTTNSTILKFTGGSSSLGSHRYSDEHRPQKMRSCCESSVKVQPRRRAQRSLKEGRKAREVGLQRSRTGPKCHIQLRSKGR
jgi:hypothetical protein